MSLNPQWNSFQPPQSNDSAIFDFKMNSPSFNTKYSSRNPSLNALEYSIGTFNVRPAPSTSLPSAHFNNQLRSNSFSVGFNNSSRFNGLNSGNSSQPVTGSPIRGRNFSLSTSTTSCSSTVGSSTNASLPSPHSFPSNLNFYKSSGESSFNKSNSSNSGNALVNFLPNGYGSVPRVFPSPLKRSSSSGSANLKFSNGSFNASVSPPKSPPNDIFTNAGTFHASDVFGKSNGASSSNFIFTNCSGNNASSSSPNNQSTRETGIIEKLLHSYGFIQCCERQARLFFHFSQFDGNIEHLKIGDPVEFEMTYDKRTGKPIASAVSKISSEVMNLQGLSDERVMGTVTTEVKNEGSNQEIQGRISYENCGECFFLPYGSNDVEGNVSLKVGDKVSFQVYTDERTGNLAARYARLEDLAQPVRYQGVICTMKDNFGFIERGDVVREIFFHISEAKEELQLGDDVEFTIQTRNGKEVAVNIVKLPPGTVIFEDVGADIVRGQVLKPLEKTPGKVQVDPLPGRIRYRGKDRSEVEISFGEKDQRGDFTLKHGDWVQFNIATDRRDKAPRATNISLLEESFSVSGEKREQGSITSISDGFGFIKCTDRESRLFFNCDEILDVDREVRVNDEVEFTVAQDRTPPNRQMAIRIKHLPSGTVQFETVVVVDIQGEITREPPSQWSVRSPAKMQQNQLDQQNNAGGDKAQMETGIITYQFIGVKKNIVFYLKDCDLRNLPKLGDKVSFNINSVKRTNELVASDIKVVSRISSGHKNGTVKCQGFVAALKDGFGFVETLSHDREVFFHFSNYDGDATKLDIGQEVEYTYNKITNGTGKISADSVRPLTKGTVPVEEVKPDIYAGIVVRPLRALNPEQSEYCGLVQIGTETEESAPTYEFGITSLSNKREILQKGDPVQFQLDASGIRAANIKALKSKMRATVDAIKGQFGFLSYETEPGKKLFFHMTEVKDNLELKEGDEVEFVVVHNPRTKKNSACNVVKLSERQRPERLISRLRTISLDDKNGPRLVTIRQPRGPDGTVGFKVSREPTALST